MRISALAKRTRKARDARKAQGYRDPPAQRRRHQVARERCEARCAARAEEGEMQENHVNWFNDGQMGRSGTRRNYE